MTKEKKKWRRVSLDYLAVSRTSKRRSRSAIAWAAEGKKKQFRFSIKGEQTGEGGGKRKGG